MAEDAKTKKSGNGKIGGIIATLASLLAIITFFTGKEDFFDFFPTKSTNTATSSTTAKPIATTQSASPVSGTGQQPTPGDITRFGPYDWRVLEVRDGKALLLSEDIIEQRAYNDNDDYEAVTWESCTLRAYLNGTFYDSFNEGDRSRIARTRNDNPDTTWGGIGGKRFNTPGGNPTDDYIFLLSVPEVLKYFPGLKLQKGDSRDEWWYEADERLVVNSNNSGIWGFWWWLRSPGIRQFSAADVFPDGRVLLCGYRVTYTYGGLRPALWLNP